MWKNLGNASNKLLSKTSDRYARRQNEKSINFNEPYQYVPLRTATSIRLLHLHHGEAGDIISADLVEVDLNDAPNFEALSYTWTLGSEAKKESKDIELRPILVDGKMLRIRMNLYRALLEFRSQAKFPPFWADQICMNQENDVEKAAQLAIMERIYSSASRVRIWLGSTSDADNGLWGVEELGVMIREVNAPNPVLARLNSDDSSKTSLGKSFQRGANWAAVSGKLVMQKARYEAAADFLANHWFSRAWTLQEFLLAKEIVFNVGYREIDHGHIATAASLILDFMAHDVWSLWFYDNTERDRYNAGNIEAVRRMFEERSLFRDGKRYTAVEYLSAIRHRQASVLKDKFFAGKALRQDRASTDITYDMTTRDIFIGFAKRSLWPDVGNIALTHVGSLSPEIEGLPTWVPDLSNPLRPVPLRLCGGPTFSAPIEVTGTPYSFEDNLLIVQAAQWTTVKATGESSWPWTRYMYEDYDATDQGHMRKGGARANERFGLMFALLNELGPTYQPTHERTLDVLWKILIGGLSPTENEGSWRERFYVWFSHNLLLMRETMRLEMDPPLSWKINGYGKRKWMVPLIAERNAMETRLSQFLEIHDKLQQNPASHPLRDMIADTQKKRWGDKTVDEFVKAQLTYHSKIMDVPLEMITEFMYRFERGYEGRRVIVTLNGFLGSSVEDVRPGDVVCLIGGMDTACVLRPVLGKEGMFGFVGEAYVHGIEGVVGGGSGEGCLEFKSVRIV